jgi:hypothetical protein
VLFALFLTCSVNFSRYVLAYDLLAATFAAVRSISPLGRVICPVWA